MSLPVVEFESLVPHKIEVNKLTEPFWSGLEDGLFQLQHCTKCQINIFPPRLFCGQCHKRELLWISSAGRGVVYSKISVSNVPDNYSITTPVDLAIIDLEERVRILTRFVPGTEIAEIGSHVQLVVTSHPDGVHYACQKSELFT